MPRTLEILSNLKKYQLRLLSNLFGAKISIDIVARTVAKESLKLRPFNDLIFVVLEIGNSQ